MRLASLCTKRNILLSLIVAAAAYRLVPHTPNVSVLEALSLAGGSYFGRKYWLWIVPIAVLYLTDLVLNNTVLRSFFPYQDGFIWWDSYLLFNILSLGIIALLGYSFLKKVSAPRVLVGGLLSAIIFFIITNFGSWLDMALPYPRTLAGLGESYLAALPFFRTSLISTIVSSVFVFGLVEGLSKWGNSRSKTAQSQAA